MRSFDSNLEKFEAEKLSFPPSRVGSGLIDEFILLEHKPVERTVNNSGGVSNNGPATVS